MLFFCFGGFKIAVSNFGPHYDLYLYVSIENNMDLSHSPIIIMMTGGRPRIICVWLLFKPLGRKTSIFLVCEDEVTTKAVYRIIQNFYSIVKLKT